MKETQKKKHATSARLKEFIPVHYIKSALLRICLVYSPSKVLMATTFASLISTLWCFGL